MALPNHDPSRCSHRTHPTTCQDCGKKVYFLACSCGSKVLFDSLGWPWPEHRENSCPYGLGRAVAVDRGISQTRLLRSAEARARRLNEPMLREGRRALQALANRQTGGTTVVTVLPTKKHHEGIEVVAGTVFEVNQVNIFERSGMYPKGLGPKLLEDLGCQPLVELFLQGTRDPRTGLVDRYPIIAHKEGWERCGIRQHDSAEVAFRKRELPNGYLIWFAEEGARAEGPRNSLRSS